MTYRVRIVHVRQGDTVEFTLTNQGTLPHSMDFHAAQIDPKVALRSVPAGQSISYTFRPKYAGPNLSCGFYVVGEQFDTVYLGSPPQSAIHGV